MIDHFTVVCLLAWPLNENEAGGDLGGLPFDQKFRCEFREISMGEWYGIFQLTAPEWKMMR